MTEGFLSSYIEIWKSNSLSVLKEIISGEYSAREVTKGLVEDFGYRESIQGWKEGFSFIKENEASWILNKLAVIPLNTKEIMVIISANIELKGKMLDNGNLFFKHLEETTI
uniref:flavoprotein n=1 Tax=Niallia taxi TaxID=2499688 RepID=UPI003F49556F